MKDSVAFSCRSSSRPCRTRRFKGGLRGPQQDSKTRIAGLCVDDENRFMSLTLPSLPIVWNISKTFFSQYRFRAFVRPSRYLDQITLHGSSKNCSRPSNFHSSAWKCIPPPAVYLSGVSTVYGCSALKPGSVGDTVYVDGAFACRLQPI